MSRVARGPQNDAAAARRLLKGLTGEAAALRMAKGCYVLVGPSGALGAKQSEWRNAWSNFACDRIGSSEAAKILFFRKRDGPCFAGRKPAMTRFASSIS